MLPCFIRQHSHFCITTRYTQCLYNNYPSATRPTPSPSKMPDLHSLPTNSRPSSAIRNNGPDSLALERYKLRELAEGWPCYRCAIYISSSLLTSSLRSNLRYLNLHPTNTIPPFPPLQRRLRVGQSRLPLPPERLHLHDLDRTHALHRLHRCVAARHGRWRLHHAPLPRPNDRHRPGAPDSRHHEDESDHHAALRFALPLSRQSFLRRRDMRRRRRIGLPVLLFLGKDRWKMGGEVRAALV